jgi:8-oxo-dGTP diphosphatase
MAQEPTLAAGGIVARGGHRPLVAIVQRRKDRRWVLPKGKLKPKESPLAAARREVIEETGHDVLVHEFLGVMTYEAGGKPKVVQFWRMQAVGDEARPTAPDIKAVKWLPLAAAIKKLDLPHEQVFLRHVGRRALKAAEPAAVTAPARPAPAVEATPANANGKAVRIAETPAALAVPETPAAAGAPDAPAAAAACDGRDQSSAMEATPSATPEPRPPARLPALVPVPAKPTARPNLLLRIMQRFRREAERSTPPRAAP